MIDTPWHADRQIRRGAFITLLVAGLALLGPWLAPHAPTAMVGPVYGPPAAGAPLGHDFLGHDLLSRLLSGGLSVLWMSVAAATLALLVGGSLGLLAGFSRRRLDQAISWAADVSLAFPDLILVLLIVSMLGRAPWLIVLTAFFTPLVWACIEQPKIRPVKMIQHVELHEPSVSAEQTNRMP